LENKDFLKKITGPFQFLYAPATWKPERSWQHFQSDKCKTPET